jgi:hypothetical protein
MFRLLLENPQGVIRYKNTNLMVTTICGQNRLGLVKVSGFSQTTTRLRETRQTQRTRNISNNHKGQFITIWLYFNDILTFTRPRRF